MGPVSWHQYNFASQTLPGPFRVGLWRQESPQICTEYRHLLLDHSIIRWCIPIRSDPAENRNGNIMGYRRSHHNVLASTSQLLLATDRPGLLQHCFVSREQWQRSQVDLSRVQIWPRAHAQDASVTYVGGRATFSKLFHPHASHKYHGPESDSYGDAVLESEWNRADVGFSLLGSSIWAAADGYYQATPSMEDLTTYHRSNESDRRKVLLQKSKSEIYGQDILQSLAVSESKAELHMDLIRNNLRYTIPAVNCALETRIHQRWTCLSMNRTYWSLGKG